MSTEYVLEFVRAWQTRDLDVILSYLTPDCFYHNVPIEPAIGVEAIRAQLEPFLLGCRDIEWVVHHIAAGSDGSVLTERTDRFRYDDRSVEIRVMGIFEFSDGRIRAWRDYFDMGQLNDQLA